MYIHKNTSFFLSLGWKTRLVQKRPKKRNSAPGTPVAVSKIVAGVTTGGVERAQCKLQYTESVFSVSSDFSRLEWESLAIIRVSEYMKESKRTL